MLKTVLPVMVISAFIAACGGATTPAPVETMLPPSATPAPNPTLLAEIKLETQTGTAYTIAWSPDGKTLAVASGAEITLVSDDLQEIRAVLKPKGGVLGVAWSPDGAQFATVNGFRNPTVRLWDWKGATAQLTPAGEIQAGVDQYGVAWSPDGKMLATLAGDSKTVFQIWDTNTRKQIHTFDLSYTKPRRGLNWSADSATVYGSGESPGQMVILALNVTDGTVKEFGKFPVAQADVFAVSPDASRIAISDPRGVALIIDAVSEEQLTGIKSVDGPVDLAWNPNGRTLAILSYEGTLQLWEIPR